jgi:hypothetical protein
MAGASVDMRRNKLEDFRCIAHQRMATFEIWHVVRVVKFVIKAQITRLAKGSSGQHVARAETQIAVSSRQFGSCPTVNTAAKAAQCHLLKLSDQDKALII